MKLVSIALLGLLSMAEALQIMASPRRCHATATVPRRLAHPRATAETAESTADAATSTPEEAEEDAQGPQQGDFYLWYKARKAREDYEKENPVDPFQKAMARVDGPLKTLAVLTAGYYAIPVAKALFQGYQTGDMSSALGEAFAGMPLHMPCP